MQILRQSLVVATLSMLALMLPLLAMADQQRGKLPDFTELAEKNSAAVVNISTTSTVEERGPMGRDQMEQLPEFFREFFGDPRRGQPDRPRERQSMGSGLIVSSDGYILTNNHVIEKADEIVVRLSDRRELEAEVIGTDPRTDMAVIRVDSDDLPVVQIGSSENLKVGEWVFAIGSPFGFEHSVTAGIVSAKGRALPRENYVPFIQTDVAINPGNSGGPLFNMDGEVIGVNSQIYTRSGGFMGVSFAVPIDIAMEVFEQLRDEGKVSRGWLGVMIQEVNRDLAETFGLSRPYGALVAEIMPDSPASEAGLRSGDVILEFNGEEISRSSDLPHRVGRASVGSEAELTIMRDQERKTLTFTVGELPEDDEKVAERAAPEEEDNRFGIKVESLPERIQDEWDIDGGVLVSNVGEGPARQAGIRRNDVIRQIGDRPVKSVSDFEAAVADLPSGRPVAVTIVRGGSPRIVAVRMPD